MQAALKSGFADSEIKELLKLATSAEIKDKLKKSTQEALDYGVSSSWSSLSEHIANSAFLLFS